MPSRVWFCDGRVVRGGVFRASTRAKTLMKGGTPVTNRGNDRPMIGYIYH